MNAIKEKSECSSHTSGALSDEDECTSSNSCGSKSVSDMSGTTSLRRSMSRSLNSSSNGASSVSEDQERLATYQSKSGKQTLKQ